MAILKGHDLMVFVQGNSIAYATSHTLETSADTSEISHKDIYHYWKTSTVQTLSWSLSSENLYALNTDHGKTFAQLFNIYTVGDAVDVVFSLKSEMTDYKASVPGVDPPNPDVPYTPSYPQFKGLALVTNLSVNAPDGDNATCSISFQGVGPLTLLNSAPNSGQLAGVKKSSVNKEVAAEEAEKK